jgi:hypothetical protein
MPSVNDARKFYFVYSNHGESVIQLEDYFSLLKNLFEYCLDKPLLASPTPVPGHWNILVECFNEKFVTLLRNIKQLDECTRYICIVTEFRMGDTFNVFFDPSNSNKSNGPLLTLDSWLHRFGIIEMSKKLPSYLVLKRFYEKWIKNAIGSSHYTSNDFYWKKRHDCFLEALPFFDHVWLISSNQTDGYCSIVEPERLWTVPVIPYIDHYSEPRFLIKQHDVDLLFTGTLTPHRIQIVNTLREKGFSVVTGFFPYFLRNAYLDRTKACLHIRQHKNWFFSSNMRLHTLLMAGKYIFSEISVNSEEDLLQRDFVDEVSSEEFVENVARKISDPIIETLGLKAREDYIRSTQEIRRRVRRELPQILDRSDLSSRGRI